MPQMSPMDWLILFIYFVFLYFLVLLMIYFIYMKFYKMKINYLVTFQLMNYKFFW